MAADDKGNDLSAVGVPVTGAVAYAPVATALPTGAEMEDVDYILDAAFKRLGLLTEDGGPEQSDEPDGDPIVFWQDGYSIPSGRANSTLVVIAAENTPIVRELKTGIAPTAGGTQVVDAGGNSIAYRLWSEEMFKNGSARRRAYARATVQSFVQNKSERGTPNGATITFSFGYDQDLKGHYRETVLPPVTAIPE